MWYGLDESDSDDHMEICGAYEMPNKLSAQASLLPKLCKNVAGLIALDIYECNDSFLENRILLIELLTSKQIEDLYLGVTIRDIFRDGRCLRYKGGPFSGYKITERQLSALGLDPSIFIYPWTKIATGNDDVYAATQDIQRERVQPICSIEPEVTEIVVLGE